MMLATLLEKFDLLSDAPGANRTIREVILQLAVRGMLTDQLKDESVRSQLKLAAAFGTQRGRGGEPKSEDIPFQIPDNWGWVAVGDTMGMVNGKAFKREEWSPEGTPIIRIQNLNNVDAGFNRCNAAVDLKVHVNDGDFLISWSGTPGTSFGAFIWSRGFAYLNQHIFRCELADGVFQKEFLRLAINARLDEMVSHAQGAVGLRHITKGKLEAIRLPLPPLAEQKRIVAKVDELMALCDRLEEQLQERETQHAALARASLARFAEAPTPANLEFLFHNSYAISPADLRKSILEAAFRGDLTRREKSGQATADVAVILTQATQARRNFWSKRNGVKRKYPEPEALRTSSTPRIPKTWVWESLDAVCEQITDGEHIQPPYQAEGVPMLSAKHVRDGYVTLEGAGLISEEAYKKSIERCKPEDGDILIVSVGATTGRSAIVSKCPRFAIVRSVLLLKPAIYNEYLLLWLKSPWAFTWMKQASGASAQPHLYIRDLRQMPIPITSLAEQHRIVAKVSELMALVDTLEANVAASQESAVRLLEALAFGIVTGAGRTSASASHVTEFSSRSISSGLAARTALSAEIVHRLHTEPTFGRVKHQKILHLCEHIAQLKEIDGRYSRQAAGPLDGRMIHAVEADLKTLGWYAEVPRESFGHAYQPLAEAGGHANDFATLWPDRVEQIRDLIELMRRWDTDKCELFATAYAAWNDLIIWGREPTDDAILHEVLERWHPDKQRFTRKRWKSMLEWIRREGYAPTGFGKATAAAD